MLKFSSTYKAINTFIENLFAFIITTHSDHRVACFRDDVVFLVYLYQRHLYPVDKMWIEVSSRIMEGDEEVWAIKDKAD